MTTRNFAMIKLGLCVFALTAVACGSAATPAPSAPVDPVNAAPHTVEVSFQFSDTVVSATEKDQHDVHQPAATITMRDVTDAQHYSYVPAE